MTWSIWIICAILAYILNRLMRKYEDGCWTLIDRIMAMGWCLLGPIFLVIVCLMWVLIFAENLKDSIHINIDWYRDVRW